MDTESLLVMPTPEHVVALERLGDEIAALSAHLDAATARLLDLIREFDALYAANIEQGLHIDAGTSRVGWLGERFDVGRAIDVLHRLRISRPRPRSALAHR